MKTLTVPLTYIDGKTGEVQEKLLVKNPRVSEFKPTQDYHPTQIIGICSICKTVGYLDFPQGFTYKVGDRAMNRQKVQCFCFRCEKTTEFVPLIEDGIKTDEGRAYLKKLENEAQSLIDKTEKGVEICQK